MVKAAGHESPLMKEGLPAPHPPTMQVQFLRYRNTGVEVNTVEVTGLDMHLHKSLF
jgi:hypothetical protein